MSNSESTLGDTFNEKRRFNAALFISEKLQWKKLSSLCVIAIKVIWNIAKPSKSNFSPIYWRRSLKLSYKNIYRKYYCNDSSEGLS